MLQESLALRSGPDPIKLTGLFRERGFRSWIEQASLQEIGGRRRERGYEKYAAAKGDLHLSHMFLPEAQ